MNVAQLILDWAHTMAVVIWIGGAIFYDMILGPSMQPLSPDQAGKLMGGILKRFPPLVWGLIGVIATTGLLRAYFSGLLNQQVLLNTSFGIILLSKMALFVVMIVIGVIITRTGIRLSKNPPPEYIPKAQKQIKLLSEANIILGIIVILLAVA